MGGWQRGRHQLVTHALSTSCVSGLLAVRGGGGRGSGGRCTAASGLAWNGMGGWSRHLGLLRAGLGLGQDVGVRGAALEA